MHKSALSIGLVIVSISLVFLLQPGPADSARVNCREDVERLMRDVHSLNLLNGLYLSGAQMKELLPRVKEAGALSKGLDEILAARGDQFAAVLKEIKGQLADNVDITDAVKQEFEKMKGPVEKKMVEAEERMHKLADETYEMLNENQRCILGEYKPCIVPQRSVANPERIGQVGGGEILVGLLEKVREIPDDRYPEAKRRVIEMATQAVKIHFKDESDRAETVRRLGETMDKVRTMSDVDFELKKNELADAIPAQTLAPTGRQRKLQDRQYITQFLLNPANAEILEKKLKREQGG